PRNRAMKDVIAALGKLGVRGPVVFDRDGSFQKTLGAFVVPSIALVDVKGTFCFTNASSLKDPIRGGIDLRESIRIAARGATPPVVGGHLRYYPANDFIGERFKDVTLPDFKSGAKLTLSDHVKPEKITALFYWGATCPYSKQVMPGVVAAART